MRMTKSMKAAVRSNRKSSARLRQNRSVSRESTVREEQQERISQSSPSFPRSQKQQDFFTPEESYILDQFPYPRNESAVVWTGARRLLLSVLQDALRSLFQYHCSRTLAGKRIFRETQAWLLSSEQRGLYSFENVCAYLALDPVYIRKGLQRFLHETEQLSISDEAGVSSSSARSPRRPFRLTAGPGSRIPSKSQDWASRKSAKRTKTEKTLRSSDALEREASQGRKHGSLYDHPLLNKPILHRRER